MTQSAADEVFQRRAAAREAERARRSLQFRDAERPILEDLRDVGVDLSSVWDLVNTNEPYPAALPILMSHLSTGAYPDRALVGIARALAVPAAAVYWSQLRQLYDTASGPDAAEGIAVALAASASPANIEALVELVGDESRGRERVRFVEPIVKLGGTRGRDVVELLLDDAVVGKEASASLSRLTS